MLLSFQRENQPYNRLLVILQAVGVVSEESPNRIFWLHQNARRYSIQALASAAGSWLHNHQFDEDESENIFFEKFAEEIMRVYKRPNDQLLFRLFAGERHSATGDRLRDAMEAVKKRWEFQSRQWENEAATDARIKAHHDLVRRGLQAGGVAPCSCRLAISSLLSEDETIQVY